MRLKRQDLKTPISKKVPNLIANSVMAPSDVVIRHGRLELKLIGEGNWSSRGEEGERRHGILGGGRRRPIRRAWSPEEVGAGSAAELGVVGDCVGDGGQRGSAGEVGRRIEAING